MTRQDDGTLVVAPRGDMCVPDELKTLIASLGAPLGELATDTEALGTEVAKWFDQSMDRVAGWYKRKTQLVLLAIGVVIVVWANANVIRYASALSVSSSAREIVVAAAELIVNPSASPETSASPAASTSPAASAGAASAEPAPSGSPTVGLTTDQALADLTQLGFAIGWDPSAPPGDSRHVPARLEEVPAALGANLLGWLFTIAAVSMGAPFWFDALKNLVNLRGAGAKPPSTQDTN